MTAVEQPAAPAGTGSPERDRRRDELVAAGLLAPTGVDGVYARAAAFEQVVEGVQALARASAAEREPGTVAVRFPPVMPRPVLVQTDYLAGFPDLVGSVDVFTGTDRDHRRLLDLLADGADWTTALTPSGVVLTPAACHPLYALLARTTPVLPAAGGTWDVAGWCFRSEPSSDPARQQSFRMQEVVRVGSEAATQEHRDGWAERAVALLAGLGLEVEVVVANDPFFGRAGRLLAAGQREQALKLELVAPTSDDPRPTAVVSANRHGDHFGEAFGLRVEDPASSAGTAVAHSACVGFGLERVALALLHVHGLDTGAWPAAVRAALALP